jgi:hypothetical protein
MAPLQLTGEMLEAHEDRIQGLEHEKERIKGLEVKFDHLTDLVKTGFGESREQFRGITARLDDGQRLFGAHEESLRLLQAGEDQRRARGAWVKKTALGLVVGGAGILVGKFAEVIWKTFSGM